MRKKGYVEEYPTMQWLGIPMHTQSMKMYDDEVWEFLFKIELPDYCSPTLSRGRIKQNNRWTKSETVRIWTGPSWSSQHLLYGLISVFTVLCLSNDSCRWRMIILKKLIILYSATCALTLNLVRLNSSPDQLHLWWGVFHQFLL